MDEHDKQFESYLRQFRLRKPGPLPEIASLSRRSSMRWVLAAATIVLIAGLSVLFVRDGGSGSGPKATVEAAGNPSLYRGGETIEAGKVIQSNSAVGLVLALEDGSRIEMREQSELKLESAADGIRVRLNSGSILVMAAKQGAGHLYVQTRDAMVSVVGTVFLVNAEQSGTTVAVVEGEVHVQQGAESKKLLPGERLATNPLRRMKTVAEEISWSRGATEYVALLQQPADISPQTVPPVTQAGAAPQVKYSGLDYNDLDVPPTTRLARNPLPFKVQANYVKVTSGQIRTLITIQIRNRDLAFRDEGGGKKARAHIEGAIYRIDNRRLPGLSEDVALEFPSNTFAANQDQPTLFQESRYLSPGEYKLHITVEDKNAQSIGVQDVALNVPRIPDQELQASSLILAYSITDLPPRMLGTDMFALGEKRVKPNASGVFRSNENLNVWQEIYGLTTDQTTRKPSATFELVISQNKQEVRKLTSSSTEVLGPGQKMTYTNSVPPGNFVPGVYDLQVKVTDNLSKASFLTVSSFSLVAIPPAQSPPSRQIAGSAIFYRTCNTCHSPQVMNSQNFATKEEYSAMVGREAGKGASVTRDEIPILVDYLFDTYGKKPDTYVPSDIPLQRQVK
jgi:cytochrome c5